LENYTIQHLEPEQEVEWPNTWWWWWWI